MTLKERLAFDLKDAMKNRNEAKIRTVRLLMSAIKNFEVEKMAQATDEEIVQIMIKEAKKRIESIDMYKQAGRNDLVSEEQEELDIINSYLPEQMSEDEIRQLVMKIIRQNNLSNPKDLGTAMKLIMPQVKGKADGKLVNKIVKEYLGG
ncbi:MULTISPECIES: GatB/YqeY domain-containing protein [Pseudothermotoga]|jgi:hypothetical protein|uniref:GatB/Yqey domain protein n=1 Tax=Pseudothermotoga lettingae (strain ATCC BAA-301 / DSM 14385 / NBRC 107922 / TMO) TaxID=416591 RepID=A8F731_PSELT|nr:MULTISPECIES: GatB/YqeY domain-containing protein [Pseudothermotoga]ABV33965.1 GatB/Yqey domain protein [Pseudothermotoga lettingae TMO]KUK20989.1 MAG: GatB/Yqey domain protein [Pseudothermotoga lettingae]MDK2884589.1 uncharacterized protein [Pseudothermotoga sp.]GLI49097.1 aspartyl-tRNA amidotransferase subunit B [Pseudothermotoga lettingae TMO]HBJ80695.1 GatB/YqeY domain-containing protein [Pseudothermotoga sp.]